VPGLSREPARHGLDRGAESPRRAEVPAGHRRRYIGLELGSVRGAGSKVTVVEMTEGLLPGADRDLVNILAKRIESVCEAVLLNTKVVALKESKAAWR
jgi:hypothetical protein